MITYSAGSAYTGPIHDDDHRPIGHVENHLVRREVVRGCFQYLTLEDGHHATVRVQPDVEPLDMPSGARIRAISVAPAAHAAHGQVVLLHTAPGEDDTVLVVRRGTRWVAVTREMTREQYDAWDGTPAPWESLRLADSVTRYLALVVTMDPALFRDPAVYPALADVPSTVIPVRK
jgi:hypothetical protein